MVLPNCSCAAHFKSSPGLSTRKFTR
jgi:hypothetical protein